MCAHSKADEDVWNEGGREGGRLYRGQTLGREEEERKGKGWRGGARRRRIEGGEEVEKKWKESSKGLGMEKEWKGNGRIRDRE